MSISSKSYFLIRAGTIHFSVNTLPSLFSFYIIQHLRSCEGRIFIFRILGVEMIDFQYTRLIKYELFNEDLSKCKVNSIVKY